MVARVEAADARTAAVETNDKASLRLLEDHKHAVVGRSSGATGADATTPPAVLDFSAGDPLAKYTTVAYVSKDTLASGGGPTRTAGDGSGVVTVSDTGPRSNTDSTRTGQRDAHDSSPVPAAPDALSQSRARLEADIEKIAKHNPALAKQMEQDMATFEKRMSAKSDGAAHVDLAYKEVAKLLESKNGQLTTSGKEQVAADIIQRAAYPLATNQGFTNECILASMESRMYERNPERAAAIVVEASMTGHVRTTLDGKEISLAPSTFWDRQERGDPAIAKPRTLGDQIFQVVAFNAELNEMNKDDPSRRLRMELDKPQAPYSTGERVFDYNKHPREDVTGQPLTLPIIDATTNEAVYNNLARTHESGFTLTWQNADTPREMKKFLEQAQAAGKFPLDASVSIERDPIKAEFGGDEGIKGAMREGINWHQITVTGYDSHTGQIHYRSSNDGSVDRTMTVQQMYEVLHPPLNPEQLPTMIQDVQKLAKEQPASVKDFLSMLTIQDRERLISEYYKATHTRLDRLGGRS